MNALLECCNVTKFYGGLAAVDGLSFSVSPGEIFGIAGPNGAGKTTLFDVISGHTPISGGEIIFDGIPIQRMHSSEICRMGISRTFQIPVVFSSQSVLMNTVVGAQFGHPNRSILTLMRFEESIVRSAREALEFVGLLAKAKARSNSLSLFDKKRLMLASALATEPRILMLDEPVGGLNPTEVDELMRLIRRVREHGITVIIIEHVMKALMGLSDRVLIMHFGQKLFEGLPEEASRDPQVLKIYLGDHFTNNRAPLKEIQEGILARDR